MKGECGGGGGGTWKAGMAWHGLFCVTEPEELVARGAVLFPVSWFPLGLQEKALGIVLLLFREGFEVFISKEYRICILSPNSQNSLPLLHFHSNCVKFLRRFYHILCFKKWGTYLLNVNWPTSYLEECYLISILWEVFLRILLWLIPSLILSWSENTLHMILIILNLLKCVMP